MSFRFQCWFMVEFPWPLGHSITSCNWNQWQPGRNGLSLHEKQYAGPVWPTAKAPLGAARVILGKLWPLDICVYLGMARLLCPPVIRFIKIYPMNIYGKLIKKAPKKSMDVWCWLSHRFFGTAIRTGCVLCAGSFGSIFVASDSQVSQVDAPLLLTRHHELPPQSALVLPS